MKHYPCSARYQPKYSRLAYPVRVLAERQAYGRTEYQIHAQDHPDSGTCWVTAGKDGSQLTFTNQED